MIYTDGESTICSKDTEIRVPDDNMIQLRKQIKKILYSYLLYEDFGCGNRTIDELFLPKAIDRIMKKVKAVI